MLFRSPLLEDIHLSGARGVLVNITASRSMKLKEVHEVMNTIRSFTAEDATVIYGSVVDDAIGDVVHDLGAIPALHEGQRFAHTDNLVIAGQKRAMEIGRDDLDQGVMLAHAIDADLWPAALIRRW